MVTATPTPPFEVPGCRSGIPNLHLHIYTFSMSHWQKQSRRNGMCQIWQKRPTRKDLPPSKQEACFLLDLSCCLVHQLWGPECLPKTKETWKCHLRPNRSRQHLLSKHPHQLEGRKYSPGCLDTSPLGHKECKAHGSERTTQPSKKDILLVRCEEEGPSSSCPHHLCISSNSFGTAVCKSEGRISNPQKGSV